PVGKRARLRLFGRSGHAPPARPRGWQQSPCNAVTIVHFGSHHTLPGRSAAAVFVPQVLPPGEPVRLTAMPTTAARQADSGPHVPVPSGRQELSRLKSTRSADAVVTATNVIERSLGTTAPHADHDLIPS
ncbi:hypothetical protein AB0J28_14345, partial [Streptosporangium canum]|uniref:hypothetical protein n=1 Tax=Streptosporangium canum TaxID=324952 RepID=UPI003429D5F7